MLPNYLNTQLIDDFIRQALAEDEGIGDHTSLACIPDNSKTTAKLLIKQDGIIAGINLAQKILNYVDHYLIIENCISEGQYGKVGEIAFTVSGATKSLLLAERLMLNCMQRMSGIATYTAFLQNLISHTHAKVLDTRKTTPNFRLFEKWAVKIGGGENHRIGLYDMILIKDNHIKAAGGIKNALNNAFNYLESADFEQDIDVEIEVANLVQLTEVLEIGKIKRIMLDNMSCEDMKKAVSIVNHRFHTEASGNISEKNIKEVAETGVDFISLGALTHSYKSLDLSFKIQ